MSSEQGAGHRRSFLRRAWGRLRTVPSRARSAPGAPPTSGAVARARAASGAGRWEEAIAAWTDVLRAGEGPRATALTQLAHAHRRLGRSAEAEVILGDAVDAHPDHVGLAVEHAKLAVTERDWPTAAERWARVVEVSADGVAPTTWTQLTRAQLQLGDLDAVATTLERARQEHPADVAIATEHARLAAIERSWGDAVERWELVRTLGGDPPAVEVFDQLAKAHLKLGDLRRAERVLDEGRAVYPDDVDLAARAARAANLARDWPEVVDRWCRVLELADDGGPPVAYTQLSRAHQALGDLDSAERIVALGRERHPDDLDVAVRWALLAAVARRWDEALARHSAVVDRFTDAPPAVHRDRARAAAELERWDVVEGALDTGLERHPGDPTLLVERTFIAVQRDDWEQVATRWHQATSTAVPGIPPELYVGMARRCAAAFRHDLADEVTEQGLARYPDDRRLQRQHVRNAISRQRLNHAPQEWDWSETSGRTRGLLQRYREVDGEPDDHVELATELADATALEEAIEVLGDGLRVHPDSTDIRDELAVYAGALGRWDTAAEHLQALVAREGTSWSHRSALVRAHLGRDDPSAARAVVEAASDVAHPARVLAELARVANHEGDVEEAARCWHRVVMLEPSSLSARRRLATALRRTGDRDGAAAVVAAARADGLPLEGNPGVVAIIGGGPSLRGTDLTPLRGVAHVVAVNATATVLPWSDVAVTHDASHLAERFRGYDHTIVAGLPLAALRTRGRLPGFEFRRRLVTDRLSDRDDVLHSGGHTSAHTALNYAHLLGPERIVLFGIDLTEFWGPGDYWHETADEYNQRRFTGLAARPTFDRWSAYRSRKLTDAPAVFASTRPQLDAAGTTVINASPVSSLQCFPKTDPAAGIRRCVEDALADPSVEVARAPR